MELQKPLSAPPQKLAAFEIIRRLGAGGMAEVFLAKKRGAEGTYKVLVVKRILPSYGTSLRFRSMFVETDDHSDVSVDLNLLHEIERLPAPAPVPS